jgi:hypothetical protein
MNRGRPIVRKRQEVDRQEERGRSTVDRQEEEIRQGGAEARLDR